jgi:hypothetical protein
MDIKQVILILFACIHPYGRNEGTGPTMLTLAWLGTPSHPIMQFIFLKLHSLYLKDNDAQESWSTLGGWVESRLGTLKIWGSQIYTKYIVYDTCEMNQRVYRSYRENKSSLTPNTTRHDTT